ncbi:MAG: site-2 protease family protein [Betaproteobacteria bacterium]
MADPKGPVAQPTTQALDLPALREDLRLIPAESHRDGSPSWRIVDPVRNAFFQIGWLEFELLARWREHADAESLVAAVANETPLQVEVHEVEELISFLAANQLLAPGSKVAREALARHAGARQHTWYEKLLHHYLFFRLPLFRPDAFLARTVALTDVFFTRGFLLLLIALLGLDLYLVSREWHSFSTTMSRMMTPGAFLYYAIAVSFSKVVHEFAHAYAARRYGVRVPTMGIAFLVLWPFLYTDVSETWKLADRRKQLVIASAGMAAELALAIISTFLWALSPEGPTKNVLFILASTTWVITLAINLSPFMRFDGYFVLSDLLDFPNLHERAGACARWWLRKTFFGMDLPTPEPDMKRSRRAALVLFAYVTWAYRLMVFLGIALLVYHIAFKLLGIFLALVEIAWFVARPVWQELAYLWKERKRIHVAWKPFALAAIVLAAFVWTVPVSHQVTAPAVLRAQLEHAVYAPFPAKVTAVRVADLQRVPAEAELVTLEALDLAVRSRKADIGIASARAELSRMPASLRSQENYKVLQQQLAQAMAERQAVDEEAARQQMRSALAGTVRDMAPDLVPGRWVNSRQLLMRVVSQETPVIEAFVDERQVAAIEAGQAVKFYPQRPDRPVIEGRVLAVDRSPQKELTRPLLASTYGGAIEVKQGAQGALVAQDAVFRVVVKPVDAFHAVDAVIHGSVRIETDLRFVAENFVYRVLSVLIRESSL